MSSIMWPIKQYILNRKRKRLIVQYALLIKILEDKPKLTIWERLTLYDLYLKKQYIE